MEFLCNICGHPNRSSQQQMDRERPSCQHCGSNVRTRGLVHALAMELFGEPITLPEFPILKSMRALGMSDSHYYAEWLARRFDYRNTFFDRPPRFDITNPPQDELGKYDFLISSEVFEHVSPPVDAAFGNAFRLLKRAGFLLLTVPYTTDSPGSEHFPELHEFGVARIGERPVLVNRTASGQLQVFDDVVFHRGVSGESLEMREFSQTCLTASLHSAGFRDIRIYSEDYAPFGIVNANGWSLPIVAHKEPFSLDTEATREIVEQWCRHMKRLRQNFWFRVGDRLGLL